MLQGLKAVLCPTKRELSGTVVRIGPYHGHAELDGIVMLVQETAPGWPLRKVVVLRATPDCDYPAGLTKEGDEVSMQVDSRGMVLLSSFENKQLTQLLNQANGASHE